MTAVYKHGFSKLVEVYSKLVQVVKFCRVF